MNEAQCIHFVRASAAALGLTLDEARVMRVAAHLQRTAEMAARLEAMSLTPEDEPVALFVPAPFPAEERASA